MNISRQTPVQFGAFNTVHGSNRDVRWIITKDDVDRFNNVTLKAAETLDKKLIEAGIDLSAESTQAKMHVLWPLNYIRIGVADEASKTLVTETLKALGATDSQGDLKYDHADVRVRTFEEIKFTNGWPLTLFKKLAVDLGKRLGLIQG